MWLVAVLAGLAVTGSSGGGLAGAAVADHVSIIVPPNVIHSTDYDVTVQGFSARRATVYTLVDYTGCARSFSAELSRITYKPYKYAVRGAFNEVSGWTSSGQGIDHACAYLIGSHPVTLLASARVSFRIH
jgi:hypothetical protein